MSDKIIEELKTLLGPDLRYSTIILCTQNQSLYHSVMSQRIPSHRVEYCANLVDAYYRSDDQDTSVFIPALDLYLVYHPLLECVSAHGLINVILPGSRIILFADRPQKLIILASPDMSRVMFSKFNVETVLVDTFTQVTILDHTYKNNLEVRRAFQELSRVMPGISLPASVQYHNITYTLIYPISLRAVQTTKPLSGRQDGVSPQSMIPRNVYQHPTLINNRQDEAFCPRYPAIVNWVKNSKFSVDEPILDIVGRLPKYINRIHNSDELVTEYMMTRILIEMGFVVHGRKIIKCPSVRELARRGILLRSSADKITPADCSAELIKPGKFYWGMGVSLVVQRISHERISEITRECFGWESLFPNGRFSSQIPLSNPEYFEKMSQLHQLYPMFNGTLMDRVIRSYIAALVSPTGCGAINNMRYYTSLSDRYQSLIGKMGQGQMDLEKIFNECLYKETPESEAKYWNYIRGIYAYAPDVLPGILDICLELIAGSTEIVLAPNIWPVKPIMYKSSTPCYADLIIDDMLLEIKTIAVVTYKAWLQTLLYAALWNLQSKPHTPIKFLGIIELKTATLYTIDISGITPKMFSKFLGCIYY